MILLTVAGVLAFVQGEPPGISADFWNFSHLQFWLVSLIGSMMLARSILREKEAGTIEVLGLSPITSLEILAGKTLSELAAIGFVLLAGFPRSSSPCIWTSSVS